MTTLAWPGVFPVERTLRPCDGIGPKIEELGSGNKGRRRSGSIAAPVVPVLDQEEPRMLKARLCQVKSLLRLLEIG